MVFPYRLDGRVVSVAALPILKPGLAPACKLLLNQLLIDVLLDCLRLVESETMLDIITYRIKSSPRSMARQHASRRMNVRNQYQARSSGKL